MSSAWQLNVHGVLGPYLLPPALDGQVLVGKTADLPSWLPLTGDVSIDDTGLTAVAALAALRAGKEGALFKARLATTGNVNLATTGLTAIDGVTPVAGDLVLVSKQTTGAQNGVYVASAGAWTRAKNVAGADVLKPGLLVIVNEGTVFAGALVRVSNATLVVGTDTPTFDALRVVPFERHKVVTGHNGAGVCTATGLKVGDKIVGVVNLTDATDGIANFEAVVTVADQLQQSSVSDLSTKVHHVVALAQS